MTDAREPAGRRTDLSPEGRTWLKHSAHYFLAGKGGLDVLAVWNAAMCRALELGAGTPARAAEMLAQEFLSGHGLPRDVMKRQREMEAALLSLTNDYDVVMAALLRIAPQYVTGERARKLTQARAALAPEPPPTP